VEVPVDGELMLTESQAADLGDAGKAKPQPPAIESGEPGTEA
jgi:hypothetical protein